jgi:hypothetical protein
MYSAIARPTTSVTLQLVPDRTADEFDAAFAAMDQAHAEAVMALASSLTYSHRARLGTLRASTFCRAYFKGMQAAS